MSSSSSEFDPKPRTGESREGDTPEAASVSAFQTGPLQLTLIGRFVSQLSPIFIYFCICFLFISKKKKKEFIGLKRNEQIQWINLHNLEFFFSYKFVAAGICVTEGGEFFFKKLANICFGCHGNGWHFFEILNNFFLWIFFADRRPLTLKKMNQKCKVCGEPAAGFHFGAFTCEGCKVSRSFESLTWFNEWKIAGVLWKNFVKKFKLMRVVGGHLADDLFNFIFIASVREMSRWSVTGRHLPLGSGHF